MLRSPSLDFALVPVRSTVLRGGDARRCGLHLWQRLGAMLAAYGAGIRDGRQLSARYDALAGMSTAELARRGLARRDIPQVVGSSTVV